MSTGENNKDGEMYGLDDAESPPDDESSASPPEDAADSERVPDPVPLEHESTVDDLGETDDDRHDDGDDPASAPTGVKALDICPNCGSPMRESKTLVCLRCGFDLKTMQVIKTVTGEVTAEEIEEEEDDEDAPKQPVSTPGLGNYLLPGIMGGFSAIVMTIGYFSGAGALFPDLETTEGLKFGAMFNKWGGAFLAMVVATVGCGLAGLAVMARLDERKVGNWGLAAARMAAIAATMLLAKYIDFGARFLEIMAEWILHAGIFVGLSMYFFRLSPRNAGIVAMTALLVAGAIALVVGIIT